MLGHGHVLGLSVSSLVNALPCVRMESNRHAILPGRVLQFEAEPPFSDSPKEPRLLALPSIASTSSMQFGGERMIKARQCLLDGRSLEGSERIAPAPRCVSA